MLVFWCLQSACVSASISACLRNYSQQCSTVLSKKYLECCMLSLSSDETSTKFKGEAREVLPHGQVGAAGLL